MYNCSLELALCFSIRSNGIFDYVNNICKKKLCKETLWSWTVAKFRSETCYCTRKHHARAVQGVYQNRQSAEYRHSLFVLTREKTGSIRISTLVDRPDFLLILFNRYVLWFCAQLKTCATFSVNNLTPVFCERYIHLLHTELFFNSCYLFNYVCFFYIVRIVVSWRVAIHASWLFKQHGSSRTEFRYGPDRWLPAAPKLSLALIHQEMSVRRNHLIDDKSNKFNIFYICILYKRLDSFFFSLSFKSN